MITKTITGYNAERASKDLERAISNEILGLTRLVEQTAKSNIRHYPEVRQHLKSHLTVLANQMINGQVTADYWQAWLEQFGKGSKMAGEDENKGLRSYMNSEYWNRIRSPSTRRIVGRVAGKYKALDGEIRTTMGSYAGVDLEELAERGDIDASFKATPPTFFLRKALESNRARILENLHRIISEFPYHKYFTRSGGYEPIRRSCLYDTSTRCGVHVAPRAYN